MDFKSVNVRDNNIDLDGQRISEIVIPSGYVPYTFMPHQDIHAILTGDKLREGNVVILADNSGRDDPARITPDYREKNPGFTPSSYDRQRISETARWAIVTSLKTRGDIVSFVALYSDGTMIPRTYSKRWQWAVIKSVEVVIDNPVGHIGVRSYGEPLINPDDIITGILKDHHQGISPEVKPAASPNWKRLLRDAMTLKQVHEILKERDAHFAAKREQNEAAKETMSEPVVKDVMYIRSGDLRMNDVFDLAGRPHQIVGLDTNKSNEMIVRASRVTGAGSIITTIIVPKYLRFEIETRS